MNEFFECLRRANALALAVAVIVGTVISKVVSSVLADVLMPIMSLFVGGGNGELSGYRSRQRRMEGSSPPSPSAVSSVRLSTS
jgi:large conductance mechanosensitive channel